MDLERQTAAHYAHGALEQALLGALVDAGKDIDALTVNDLSAIDEFHLGWRAATMELGQSLGLKRGLKLLDIGAGLGGPARLFATQFGCEVEGVDLSPEYVAMATELTRRCGLERSARFRQGSALELPFDSAAFDRAALIHVGMNIDDKAQVFAEARRVLRPGGLFCVYDVMRLGDGGGLVYPTPWAGGEATSFLETPAAYRRLLGGAGFKIEAERDRSGLTRRLFAAMRAHAEKNGPPKLGLHLLMGSDARTRLGNVMRAVEAGAVAPVELIARTM